VFIECPGFEQMVSHSHRIGEVMDEVARYYHADLCILTWREQGRLCFKAGDRMGTIDVPRRRAGRFRHDYHLFNHVIARELPIIVPDVQQDEAYRWVSLPPPFTSGVRFYAAAPLVHGCATFIGTLCILDFTRPRANFRLDAADFLVEKANELVAIAENAMPSLSGCPSQQNL
jgi:GAF domain-containing protein